MKAVGRREIWASINLLRALLICCESKVTSLMVLRLCLKQTLRTTLATVAEIVTVL